MNLKEDLEVKVKRHQDALLKYIELKRINTNSALDLNVARQEVMEAADDLWVLRQDIISYA